MVCLAAAWFRRSLARLRKRSRSLVWAALLPGAVLISACATPSAPSAGAAPQASPGTGCQLTVSITAASGTVWGSVTAAVSGSTVVFDGASRSITVPCGAKVELSERPTDSTDWPFHGWRVGTKTVAATRTSAVVTAAVQVLAIFVPAPGLTASPTSSPSGN